jgi:hypothetical protein
VSDLDDIDAKETARAQAAAEAGCARLLELLRQHHPKTINETLAPGKKKCPGEPGQEGTIA